MNGISWKKNFYFIHEHCDLSKLQAPCVVTCLNFSFPISKWGTIMTYVFISSFKKVNQHKAPFFDT